MSRRLLCVTCNRGRQAGRRVALVASEMGEPAEYERIVYGRAVQPTTEQRTMYVNGDPVPLPTDAFEEGGQRVRDRRENRIERGRVMGDGKTTKPAGWFSRRHRDGLAHREAVDRYQANRGPDSRRVMAMANLEKRIMAQPTPERTREYLALEKRISG